MLVPLLKAPFKQCALIDWTHIQVAGRAASSKKAAGTGSRPHNHPGSASVPWTRPRSHLSAHLRTRLPLLARALP